eukprot:CAMPEP_0170070162 /NCGR_PEP_ID=MMETSP0019_2-20121128/8561_1 /TAXON_ID=98059 /ORGANISM="Dinobryon sp., Strain UTEXLB2267" /LENGTH=763 /DNA_ID=CAMNT_0010278379 /DNA_START=191 /DNA_END=2483 /DNA_ORIENTATION=+
MTSDYSGLTLIFESRMAVLSPKDANIVITRTFRLLSKPGYWALSKHILDLLFVKDFPLDTVTQSAAMTLCIRHKRFKEAVDIYEAMQHQEMPLDAVAFTCAVRALCLSQRPFEAVLLLLDRAHASLGPEALSVAHTAMITYKFANHHPPAVLMACSQRIFDWLGEKAIPPTAQTLDILLAVACIKGSPEDWRAVLALRTSLRLPATLFTFNSQLHRLALRGDTAAAGQLLADMARMHTTPDATSFNTLLKLFVNTNDSASVLRTLRTMRARGLPFSDFTKSLVMRFLAAERVDADWLRQLDRVANATNMPDSGFTFANAITASRSARTALQLLQEACRLRVADEAVFVAAASVCADQGQPVVAGRVLDNMLRRQLPANGHFLSVALKAASRGNSSLWGQLAHLHRHYPWLLAGNCDRTVRALLTAHQPEAALNTHLAFFPADSCKPQTLNMFFNELQTAFTRCSTPFNGTEGDKEGDSVDSVGDRDGDSVDYSVEDSVDSDGNSGDSVGDSVHSVVDSVDSVEDSVLGEERRLAGVGEALVSLYVGRGLLRTAHLDVVLRMLGRCGSLSAVRGLLGLMEDSGTQPGTFTVAELVRCARRHHSGELAERAVRWGLPEGRLPAAGGAGGLPAPALQRGPHGLVAAAVRGAARGGAAGALAAGSDPQRGPWVLDLHRFNRGMASAAIQRAIRQIKSAGERPPGSRLVVITGRNEPRRRHVTDSRSGDSYLLSGEIQRVLIEDFLPPIGSSTVVGNPGRLYIDLAHI